MVVPSSIFWGTFILFSMVGAPLYILTNVLVHLECYITKCHNWVAYNNKKMNGSGGWEVWGQGASMVAFWWKFSSYFIASAFFLCPHLGKGVSVLSVASLLRYQFNLWRFHLHYWSTSQRPQEYHHVWELGSQHMNLGRAHSDRSTNSVQDFQCLHIFANICYLQCFGHF